MGQVSNPSLSRLSACCFCRRFQRHTSQGLELLSGVGISRRPKFHAGDRPAVGFSHLSYHPQVFARQVHVSGLPPALVREGLKALLRGFKASLIHPADGYSLAEVTAIRICGPLRVLPCTSPAPSFTAVLLPWPKPPNRFCSLHRCGRLHRWGSNFRLARGPLCFWWRKSWLRKLDLNQRSFGYEPNELLLLHPAIILPFMVFR